MWIEKMHLKNVRSFEDHHVEFSKGINILVGPNNSGKSTVAHAALAIQEGFILGSPYVRLGSRDSRILIELRDIQKYYAHPGDDEATVEIVVVNTSLTIHSKSGSGSSMSQIPSREPDNFIYPYLSRRKTVNFAEQIDEIHTLMITGNLQNLYAKIDRLSNPTMPAHALYMDACKRILGFPVTCSSSPSGKKACLVIDNFRKIDVDNMGEGVANLLGLLVDLCIAESKLFVIEEPENDLHPRALKEILGLVIEKSKMNQFIITTHSNIVAKFLGSEPSAKIFKVEMEFKNKVPTSKIELVGNDPEARQNLLRYLGYELMDLDLWEGWLFVEESSAEKIIREYLVPWFTPSVQGKLRTFSAKSIDEVESKFDDFNVLFSYLNLNPIYKNRAWVIVDKGPKEEEIINRLKESYVTHGWSDEHFQQWSKHDFESYYPQRFQEKVATVLSNPNQKEKRQQKKDLLREVESWTKSNGEEAKAAFEHSADEVIAKLRAIAEEILRGQ